MLSWSKRTQVCGARARGWRAAHPPVCQHAACGVHWLLHWLPVRPRMQHLMFWIVEWYFRLPLCLHCACSALCEPLSVLGLQPSNLQFFRGFTS